MRWHRIIVLFVAMTLLFSVPVGSFAYAPKKVVKIGDITKITGDVLVRTKGKWKKLNRRVLPYAVFNADKIVTKRGRAQLNFVDGGLLRVNLNSNLTVIEKKVKKGMFSKKLITSRQINVLVGDVWFDIKVNRDKRVTFKTPSMTAALRGTSGSVQQGLDENDSKFGLKSGKAKTDGTFEALKKLIDFNVNISPSQLPAENSNVAGSSLMTGPTKAQESQNEASKAARKAAADRKKAKGAVDIADAAVAVVEAAESEAQANLAKAEQSLEEAARIGDADTIEQAQNAVASVEEAVKAIQEQKDAVVAQAAEINEIAKTDPAAAAVKAQVAVTTAVSTASTSAKTTAITSLTIATSTGNKEAIKTAEAQIVETEKSEASAALAQDAAEKIDAQVEAGSLDTETAEKAVTVIAGAAEAIAVDAQVQAQISVETTSGDTTTLDEVVVASVVTSAVVDVVNEVISNIDAAMDSGDTDLINTTIETSETLVDESLEKIIDSTEGLELDEPTPDESPASGTT
ncbi:FecR domain-containing protein [Nitrospirota bacterium]